MASRQERRTPTETIELTEALIIHGESLGGSDAEKRAKLDQILERLRERAIDFVDQPDAFEVWVGAADKEPVLALLQEMG
ncbi:MAG: hypothetical protein HY321_17550, partial [Armatimonadetes bacterium]|nr:hypothetical protein [Armatimonadota bacterium]